MVIIPEVLPAKVSWISENGKWKIVAKVDKDPNHDFLYSWLLVQKVNKQGKWQNEYRHKHYPAYLSEKISEFEVAIRKRKKEYLEMR